MFHHIVLSVSFWDLNLSEDMKKCLPLTLCTLLALLCAVVKPKVTEEDLFLLSEDRNVPHCFSRQLDTVICYWTDEELLVGDWAGKEDVSYGFYYSYGESEVECDIVVQTGHHTLYVCEHDDVVLFNDLNLTVKDKMTNRILRRRKLELEQYVILQPPHDINVVWEDGPQRFWVTWKPPEMDLQFNFKYEVQFWSTEDQHQAGEPPPAPTATPRPTLENSPIPAIIKEVKEVLLPPLKPGLLYQVRVRTSWKYEKPSIWGPWSEAVTFTSPMSPETIGLECFTSDLSQVCCKWDETILDAQFLQVYYAQESPSILKLCENLIHQRECPCLFSARNDSIISVKLNTTLMDGKRGLYYKKPFWLNHVVLPPAPDLHVLHLPGNKLALNWSSPIPHLQKHLMYQIRFTTDKEKSWTTLQVAAGVHKKVISMVSGSSYTLQIRASPSQEEIQGYWSKWSSRVTTKSSSSFVWVTPVIIVTLLILLAAGFGLHCIFPSFYRKLKDKLWPPLPNLHRVLDTFLAEIQKQYQPDATLYEKPLEEAAQTSCLEILCELTLSSESQPASRDYVQLAPSSYQNKERWPNLEPLELNQGLSANDPLPCDLTNQTYLPAGWSSG
ncbi:thrombopoietin receptor isoform 2-T2 [Anomaloglossus baeobatrachus]|uniref:thrombopoietin receptor isoform X2 n=1 Tax=Anomaloglossus baeobatrachus TaxID=238106 RepID=UPI003F50AD90